MVHDPRNASPFHALPPVVVALAAVIGGLELMFQLADAGLLGGGAGLRTDAIRDWGVAGPVLDWMLANRAAPPELLARFVTYPFLHGSAMHAVMVVVFVLALGNAVAPHLPGWRPAALFLGPAVAGGLAYAALFDGLLFGGYAGAYGLIGGFAWLTRRGLTRVPPDRAFLLIGLLLAIQPVFGLVGGMGLGWVPHFVAEAVGAAAGYALAGALFPGGPSRLRARLRQR